MCASWQRSHFFINFWATHNRKLTFLILSCKEDQTFSSLEINQKVYDMHLIFYFYYSWNWQFEIFILVRVNKLHMHIYFPKLTELWVEGSLLEFLSYFLSRTPAKIVWFFPFNRAVASMLRHIEFFTLSHSLTGAADSHESGFVHLTFLNNTLIRLSSKIKLFSFS